MTNKFVVPSHAQISKTGSALEVTGAVIAALCLAVGIISMFGTGTPIALLGAPFGVLLMIAGYASKAAEASMATFIALTQDSALMAELQVRTEQ